MNLHRIVAGAIGAINPNQTATIAISTGYRYSTSGSDGTRIPTYADPVAVVVQVQEMTSKDLQVADGLNLQGETKSIYLNGDWEGVLRPDGRGGDLITLGARVYLVVKVLENYEGARGWTKVMAVLQMDRPA